MNVTSSPGVDLSHVNPTLLQRFYAFAQANAGDRFVITSGYRSRAEQQRLWDRYVASGYDPRYIAARPGLSNHERGEAIDVWAGGGSVALNNRYTDPSLALYGIHTPVGGDQPHTTRVEVRG